MVIIVGVDLNLVELGTELKFEVDWFFLEVVELDIETLFELYWQLIFGLTMCPLYYVYL